MRPMTPDEFRAALKRCGFATSDRPTDLGQSEAARFFDAAPRAVRNWAAGEAPVPPAVALCLRLMLQLKLSRDQVAELLKRYANG
jgi:hypothetical protein